MWNILKCLSRIRISPNVTSKRVIIPVKNEGHLQEVGQTRASPEFRLEGLWNWNIRHPIQSQLWGIMGKGKAGGVYAVARGRTVGTFMTWDECKAQVDGFPNARYKKFPSSAEAQAFIEEHKGPGAYKAPVSATAPKSTPLFGSSSTSKSKPTGFGGSTRTFGAGSSRTGTVLLQQLPEAHLAGPNPGRTAQKRTFSKTALKVTEDRVVNKRARLNNETPNSDVDLTNFTVDEDGYVVVFTDGACTKNGRRTAKAGIGVWFGHDHHLNISEPVNGRQTNNTAEIQAAERAIRQAKQNGINKLKVKTDSQFTINCVTKWMYNWKRNNWRLSSGGDVKNKEDLIKLEASMQNMEIKWSYVAGHAGFEGNEAADRLAVAGAERSIAHF